MTACHFCLIAAGDVPARRIYEDDRTVAFLDVAPATRGHSLVIPKEHFADLWSMPDAAAEAVAVATRRVAHLLRDRLPLAGLNVMQANGSAAWQTVFHLHAHVVPRYRDDELTRAWTPTRAPEDELDEVLAELGLE